MSETSAKSEKSCGPNPSQCVGCRLPRIPRRADVPCDQRDDSGHGACCGKFPPGPARPGCVYDRTDDKPEQQRQSLGGGKCGPPHQAPCKSRRVPCDNPPEKDPSSADSCQDLNPCCRRAIEQLMKKKGKKFKEFKKPKEPKKDKKKMVEKKMKQERKRKRGKGSGTCCTQATCPAPAPPPCCGSGSAISSDTSPSSEGTPSQEVPTFELEGGASDMYRKHLLAGQKAECAGKGPPSPCSQKCQPPPELCRPVKPQSCPGSRQKDPYCRAKGGPRHEGPCPVQPCGPHGSNPLPNVPGVTTPTMVGQVSADWLAGAHKIIAQETGTPELPPQGDFSALPPQPVKSCLRRGTCAEEACPGKSCIGEDADKLASHCGVASCPYGQKGDVNVSCGPSCGVSSPKKCECRNKWPLTFRTCICPGFECPRIENDMIWPCPCPFPPDELDPGPENPKELAAARSRMTESTSGFKIAKKPAFEGQMSFEEALKFFAEHPEYLPPASSQTLLIPDEFHSECCCEDLEMYHDLTSCPGEPFVSTRKQRMEKKAKTATDKKDKTDKKTKTGDKKGDKKKRLKKALNKLTGEPDSSSSESSSEDSQKSSNKEVITANCPGCSTQLSLTIHGKGSASPGLSGLCCFDVITHRSDKAPTAAIRLTPNDTASTSDGTLYLMYTL